MCDPPFGFVGWFVLFPTEALNWLCAIFAFTVESVVLVAGSLVGCLLVLLISAIVCKILKSGWVYREEASRRVMVVPAMDQIKHGREWKV